MSAEKEDTIAAIATAPGLGAIAVVRLSGSTAINIADKLFPAKDLTIQNPSTLHVGLLKYGDKVLDQVVVSLYKKPHSYTGEDIVEISMHGSPHVQAQILQACIASGARLADPGEFTRRAFLNQKMDLTQAEAVADLIAAESDAQQQAALHQLRGGFSSDLNALREKLIEFSALLELELDFSEEDVEFADRKALRILLDNTTTKVAALVDSFSLGNAIKKGIRVAIVGAPNAGKSTLLNAILNDERAIVSHIAGTTRDTVEEVINLGGMLYRFIDTAGIREHTTDEIEKLGIARSHEAMKNADVILYMVDQNKDKFMEELKTARNFLSNLKKPHALVLNKSDLVGNVENLTEGSDEIELIKISAKQKTGIDKITDFLQQVVAENKNPSSTIVTNARHQAELVQILESLHAIEEGFKIDIHTDLITIDLRKALFHIGVITGAVQHDRDVLGAIFGKFCIGK